MPRITIVSRIKLSFGAEGLPFSAEEEYGFLKKNGRCTINLKFILISEL